MPPAALAVCTPGRSRLFSFNMQMRTQLDLSKLFSFKLKLRTLLALS